MVGKTLSHYRILEEIGAGGMGVVYRAHDDHLDRDVALKVLPAGVLSDESARKRFRKEALSLARLNHPNVATVHEFGNQEGVDFLVTEYIPGVTLDAKIGGKPLPAKSVLDLGIQLAQGLAAAHDQGVVHRDLKPANLRLTPDGRLKILDFGLAQLVQPESDIAATLSLASRDSTSGTLPYMPPEQLRGEKTDARSDLWAAGAVIYEMATGQRPFPDARGALLVDAILNREPKPPREINRDVSKGLENIVLKALEKDPARRYQTARDLGNDLERLTAGISPVAVSPRSFRRRPAARWIAAAVSVLVVGGALLSIPRVRDRLAAILSAGGEKHIAVLPFDNIGNNPANEAIAQGLMDSMTSKLSNLDVGQQSLWVLPASVVRKRNVDDPAAALHELGATLVVKGSIQREGSDVRLTVNLINTKTLRQVGSAELEDRAGDIAALQNEAVSRLARMMNIEVTPEMLAKTGGSVVPAAYEAYLKALGYTQRYDKPGNLDLAIDALRSAVKTDPRFAIGYAALGEAYRLKYQVDRNSQWLDEAQANCKRAIQLDDRLPASYVTLGRIHDDSGQHDLAISEFQQALRLDPRHADALNGMAHAYENANRIKDAEAAYQKAAALRPDYWDGYNTLGLFYDRQRRYDDSIAQLQQALRLTPDNAQVYLNLGAVYLDTGDEKRQADAEKALKKSIELNPSYPAYANLGFMLMQQRRYAESAAMTEKALQMNDRDYVVWDNLISAYEWLGQKEKAATAREREIPLVEEAARLNARDAQKQGTLGWLYAAGKKRDEAMPHVQAALALAPEDPTVLVLAGGAYEALGDRARALEFIEKGLQKGYALDDLKRDPDLQNLLSDPKFKVNQKK
jgi:eukaryotic-like serine/threonine-protein kinase